MAAPAKRAGSLPDLLPVRMLNEVAYCPRLFYLEWVDSQWDDNADTVDGRYAHRRVDREGGALPEAGVAEGGEEGEPATIHARSVMLSAPREGLIARLDLLEGEGRTVTPVDYKRGKTPKVEGGAWEPERVQVCAQGLILRENGYTTSGGVLYFVGSRERVEIPFTPELVERTRALAVEARRVALQDSAPPPLADSPKCPRCSLVGICLPDEVRLLASGEDSEKEDSQVQDPESSSTEDDEDRVRRLFPPRPEKLPLYVQRQGMRIGLKGELLQVREGKTTIKAEVPMREVSHVSLFGNIQVSTQAMKALLGRGTPVCFLSYAGWFYGIARGLDSKNIGLREAQWRAAFDDERSLEIARVFVESKIRNSRTLLRRNIDEPAAETLRRLRDLAKKAREVSSAESLLGIEGTAAREYFGRFSAMLRPRSGESVTFSMDGRNRRPPTDPINAMLSFAYAMLAKDLTVTLTAVGFDPYMGFYHRPRHGRPALALDVMEEFRPIICDSVVLSVVNTGVLSASDFIHRGPGVAMSDKGRRAFIQAYERRMDELVTHPLFGYRLSYRRLLDVHCRLLGRHLTGELAEPPSFRTR